MFASFLYPYNFRNNEAPCLWSFYKQLSSFDRDEILYIGSKEYFNAPEYFARNNRWEVKPELAACLQYVIPSSGAVESAQKSIICGDIFNALDRKFNNNLAVWTMLLTQRYAPLEDELESIVERVAHERKIDAFLSWSNCESLNYVARKHGIPVIYNELGPLRPPNYVFTGYFDFCGVNGNTEARKRYGAFCKEAESGTLPILSKAEILDLMVQDGAARSLLMEDSNDYEIGLPMQVEDDSNMLAYSNGWDNEKLIQLAGKYFRKNEVIPIFFGNCFFHKEIVSHFIFMHIEEIIGLHLRSFQF